MRSPSLREHNSSTMCEHHRENHSENHSENVSEHLVKKTAPAGLCGPCRTNASGRGASEDLRMTAKTLFFTNRFLYVLPTDLCINFACLHHGHEWCRHHCVLSCLCGARQLPPFLLDMAPVLRISRPRPGVPATAPALADAAALAAGY